VRLFLRQFFAELLKLFARKRTWVGFGAFVGLEMIIVTLLKTKGIQRGFRSLVEHNGAIFEEYSGGLTLAFIVMALTVILLGALFIALVAGDIVGKEVEDGTMRMTLCRPVTRTRVLLVKFMAVVVYCFVLIAFVGVSALLTGIAWGGVGGLCALAPEEQLLAFFSPSEGLVRYFGSLPFFAMSLCTIVSLAFLFSCCNMKPATATVLTLTIFLVNHILYLWPLFASFRMFFLTTHMVTWVNVFRSPVPWAKMGEDYLWLLGLNATFFIVGCTIFLRRDLKS
jgi:ABC-2 type transport system permease protein